MHSLPQGTPGAVSRYARAARQSSARLGNWNAHRTQVTSFPKVADLKLHCFDWTLHILLSGMKHRLERAWSRPRTSPSTSPRRLAEESFDGSTGPS